MAFFGAAPIGSSSRACSPIGSAPPTILAGGIACAVAGAWCPQALASLRAVVRPITSGSASCPPRRRWRELIEKRLTFAPAPGPRV
jgi:hypothetical protein